MARYNLSSNQAHGINFDQMVERVLADALAAYGTVGHWSRYFDMDDLDVDDQDEAAARIAAIWPALVKIVTVEGNVEVDPYRRDTDGQSKTELYINPAERKASILQWYPGQNGQRMSEYHKLELSYGLDIYPDETEAREYLESCEAQELLDRICEGHDTTWNGHNMVGTLSDDAQAAVEELLTALNDLPESDWEMWGVDDWLQNDSFGWLTAATTDDELAAKAKEIEAIAESDHINLNGSVLDYLTNKRNELREEADE